MTLAPAVATIHEMKRLGLVERARELGPYVEKKLQALKEKHPCVGDVRGKGLFWAVDIVRNRTTKEPFNKHIPIRYPASRCWSIRSRERCHWPMG